MRTNLLIKELGFLLVLFFLFTLISTAQTETDRLQKYIDKATQLMHEGKYHEAIDNYDLVISICEEEANKEGLLDAYYQRGKLFRMSGDYDHALADFLESLRISKESDNKKGIAFAYLNIGIIYSTRLGESSAAGLPYFLDALEISREIGEEKCISYALNNIALVYIDMEEYEKALEYHHQSLEMRRPYGDKSDIAASLGNIGDVYTLMEDHETAIEYNRQSLELYREANDISGLVYSLLEVGRAYVFLERYAEAAPYMEEALEKAREINSLQLLSGAYQYLYEYNLAIEDYEDALEYHKLYKWIEDSIYTEYSSQQIADMRTLYETEMREAEIVQLMNENTIHELKIRKSENLKIFFIVALILTIVIAAFAYYAYYQKQRANRFLEMRNRFEIENKKRAISLFGQQVSKEVALELLSDSFKSGSKKLFACIMFLDIRDFTPYAANKEPDEIIQYQNDVFGFMIDIVSKNHGIINQFMGDGFMATFGAPASSGNDCQNAVNASLEIVDNLNKKLVEEELPHTRIGIGLHAGHIVTGNVGTTERKQYSITGNTVILASRIEQLNKDYKSDILISSEVLEQVDVSTLKVQNLGKVNIKGRSEPIEIMRLS